MNRKKMNQVLAALALTVMIPASAAFSQTTTISYDAVVTDVLLHGPGADSFSPGDEVLISYTLDPTVADTQPGDPVSGIFPHAVLSLSVSFPDLGISVVAGPSASAQTWDNVNDGEGGLSDQVYIHGGPVTSTSLLGGVPIDRVEVDFLTLLDKPTTPTMLLSDALPLFKLPTIDAYVFLFTSRGYTVVGFKAVISPMPPDEQIESLIGTIEDLVAEGSLDTGWNLAAPLEGALRALAGGNVGATCSQLFAFQIHVARLVSYGVLTNEEGAGLIDAAANIRTSNGC